MPITNWSTAGGDLRVPHFIGLHSVQVFVLAVLVLTALAPGSAGCAANACAPS
ncbi:hypothetical protein [Nonomuraea diastatica]|uniref:hypothetical protein n=1 Tax=Nonomuraea diastatica TaxID=1848329 RepID=UPI00140CDE00|nr:hypothetical protein [Nonomuraea diastatica]